MAKGFCRFGAIKEMNFLALKITSCRYRVKKIRRKNGTKSNITLPATIYIQYP